MFRTSRPAARGAAVALTLTLGLSACQAGGPAPAASESVSASPSPSVSPTPADPAEAAKEKNIADAKQRYTEFVEVSDKHAKNGTNAYEEFLAGGYLGDSTIMGEQESYWAGYTDAEFRQTGDARIVSMEVNDYEGDPLADSILGQRVRMQVCVDTTGIDVLGPDGESVREGGMPERMIRDVLMQGQSTVWSVRENTGTGEAC